MRTSYDPKLIEILNGMGNSFKNLNELPIKDKEFDEIYRYITKISLFPYYTQYYSNQVSVRHNYTTPDKQKTAIGVFFSTPKYIQQYNDFLLAINNSFEAIKSDKKLSKTFNSSPHVQGSFFWGANRAYSSKIHKLLNHGINPCDTKEMSYFYEYYSAFLKWINTRSSYRSLSDHMQWYYESTGREEEAYYFAKYVCKKSFDYATYDEKTFSLEYYKGKYKSIEDYFFEKIINYYKSDTAKKMIDEIRLKDEGITP